MLNPHLLPAQTSPYRVSYTSAPALGGHILGVVGYGAARPAGLAPACPFAQAPLHPVSGGPVFEVWRAATPVTHAQVGRVAGAYSAEAAFGLCEIREDGIGLERATAQAYDQIFGFLNQTGFPEPLRFWTYLTGITDQEEGQERYWRFNTGRQTAFLRHLHQPVPPAASCLGGLAGVPLLYVLAARTAAQPIENPRQMSAYAYPPVYGPTSPSFSRASLHQQRLFISGTASITGHETRHRGDLHGQLAETLENLRAIIAAAGHTGENAGWAVKTYLRDPAFASEVAPALIALFGPQSQYLYLHAEICRADLLLEVEACHL